MPYTAGRSISPQLLANSAGQASGQIANTFGNLMDRWTQDQEQNKDLLAKSKATEKYIYEHPDMYGGEAAVERALSIDGNKTPRERYAYLTQFLDMGVMGTKMDQAKAAIGASIEQTKAATAERDRLGAIATRLDKTNRVLASPEIIQFLSSDPDKAEALAISMGGDPEIIRRFMNPTQKLRSDERQKQLDRDNDLEKIGLRGEVDVLRAQGMKIPPGFRPKAGSPTDLEVIPGGPAALEQAAVAKKERDAESAKAVEVEQESQRASSAYASVAQTLETVRDAYHLSVQGAGGPIAGTAAGAWIGNIVGKNALTLDFASKAKTLNNLVSTIKASLAIRSIQDLRRESKSGAGLGGSSSDKDLELLGKTIADLDTTLPEEELQKGLMKVMSHLMRIKAAVAPKTVGRFLIVEDDPVK